MLSKNQIKNIGFEVVETEPSDHFDKWIFKGDRTDLILVLEWGRALYSLLKAKTYDDDRTVLVEVWSGSLVQPKTLILKLIKFGNNLDK